MKKQDVAKPPVNSLEALTGLGSFSDSTWLAAGDMDFNTIPSLGQAIQGPPSPPVVSVSLKALQEYQGRAPMVRAPQPDSEVGGVKTCRITMQMLQDREARRQKESRFGGKSVMDRAWRE